MDPNVLTVYSAEPYHKIRLGKANDGGYVICDIPDVRYDLLLAAGIDKDLSFEEDFCHKYPGIQCKVFDGTIGNELPYLPKARQIEFIAKNIGQCNGLGITNLHGLIGNAKYQTIFIKMDIEGSEIPWIQSLKDEHLNKVAQFVIEFHYPFSLTEMQVFQKLNKHHYLIHFHGNNHSGMRNHQGIAIPNVFECTYLHKRYFNGKLPSLNIYPIPGSLDMKNNVYMQELYINHQPFVH